MVWACGLHAYSIQPAYVRLGRGGGRGGWSAKAHSIVQQRAPVVSPLLDQAGLPLWHLVETSSAQILHDEALYIHAYINGPSAFRGSPEYTQRHLERQEKKYSIMKHSG